MTAVAGLTGLTTRPACAADIPLLRDLYADAHVELAVLPPDSRFVLVDMQFRAERRRTLARYPQAVDEILTLDDVAVGRLLVDRSADAVHVLDLTVSLGRRRRGIGGAALEAVLAEAADCGKAVRLTLWCGNTTAIEMCRRRGFVPDDEGDGFVTLAREARSPHA